MDPVRVSVVVPAFNSAATIGRALASIANQTRTADEVIVVDDASTDETLERLLGALQTKLPALKIAGFESSKFRQARPDEDEKVVRRVGSSITAMLFDALVVRTSVPAPYENGRRKTEDCRPSGEAAGRTASLSQRSHRLARAGQFLHIHRRAYLLPGR